MRLSSPGLLFLLFTSLQADTQEKEVRAMVGSDVELSCASPEGSHFDLNDIYVYWQISDTVVAYHVPQNSSSSVASRYRNRAAMSPAGMLQGDFSLRLLNVTPDDDQKFRCVVLSKSRGFQTVLEVVVTLHVAANFSVPVVSAPRSPSQDELIFTCMSVNGYPRPRVYWINKTDGSLLDQALQNDTIVLNTRGLYDVVSVLRIAATPSVNIGCCIENALLQQNLTVDSQTGNDVGDRDKITTNPDSAPKEKNLAAWSVLAVLCLLAPVVGLAVWVCKCRRPRCSYAGHVCPSSLPRSVIHTKGKCPQVSGLTIVTGSHPQEGPGDGLLSTQSRQDSAPGSSQHPDPLGTRAFP
ncbi:ICOS ligand isoform X1 [Saimiri boliviensis]|uniref:ICOS ligand isoform X1 n=1 Tax=Saimiri boliviensis TaxID=27679 RepID=UPI00193DB332|nr:ICOS ligand isoform X1 [Saimiri boliviensis boliviensis]